MGLPTALAPAKRWNYHRSMPGLDAHGHDHTIRQGTPDPRWIIRTDGGKGVKPDIGKGIEHRKRCKPYRRRRSRVHEVVFVCSIVPLLYLTCLVVIFLAFRGPAQEYETALGIVIASAVVFGILAALVIWRVFARGRGRPVVTGDTSRRDGSAKVVP